VFFLIWVLMDGARLALLLIKNPNYEKTNDRPFAGLFSHLQCGLQEK
jgi:hypothetical protein